MRFRVRASDLAAAAARIVAESEGHPLRDTDGLLLIRAREHRLELTMSDYAYLGSTTEPADAVTAGAACVAGRRLLDVLRSFHLSDVTATLEKETLVLQRTDTGSTVRLFGRDPKLFTEAVRVPAGGAVVPAATLRSLLERTLYAAKVDARGNGLAGVYLEKREGTLRTVATDGHRIAQVTVRTEGDADLTMFLGRRAVTKILGVAGGRDAVRIAQEGRLYHFAAGDTTIVARDHGEFVGCDRGIPDRLEPVTCVESMPLVEAAQVAMAVGDQDVRLSFTSSAVIVAPRATTHGSARIALPADVTGPAHEVVVSGEFLVKALEMVQAARVVIGVKAPEQDGIVIRDAEATGTLAVIQRRG